jgi:hypothetical protein
VCNAHAADDGKEALTFVACPNGLAIRSCRAMAFCGLRFAPLERTPHVVSSKTSAAANLLSTTLCGSYLPVILSLRAPLPSAANRPRKSCAFRLSLSSPQLSSLEYTAEPATRSSVRQFRQWMVESFAATPPLETSGLLYTMPETNWAFRSRGSNTYLR